MVFEHAQDHASQWAAITSIAEKIGCAAETLRSWVRQAERDRGSAARADDGRTRAVEAVRTRERRAAARERDPAAGVGQKGLAQTTLMP
jgi:transposase-like protein